ncbi:two-CW domain-containing protein [Marinifilum sp. RC60d5]|uniref:two-CW domain-containing protein n=1 Tax=Marinifilum sp. RC60d5 TaxID=3458414 RepID=UPI0040371B50
MVQNCWEYFECGREIGGTNTKEMGICPASTRMDLNNINEGKSAGRYCWTIAGTLCNDLEQGKLDEKLLDCINCSFLKKVNNEQGREFVLLSEETLKKVDY